MKTSQQRTSAAQQLVTETETRFEFYRSKIPALTELSTEEKAEFYDKLQVESYCFDGEGFTLDDLVCYNDLKSAYKNVLKRESIIELIENLNNHIIAMDMCKLLIDSRVYDDLVPISSAATLSSLLANIDCAWVCRMNEMQNI